MPDHTIKNQLSMASDDSNEGAAKSDEEYFEFPRVRRQASDLS